jgi:hypothetical protein
MRPLQARFAGPRGRMKSAALAQARCSPIAHIGDSGIDWPEMESMLDQQGHVILPAFLPRGACDALIAGYDDATRYRTCVVMERHGFGRGEYKYFNYPLPPLVDDLRRTLYPHLVPIANRWNDSMGMALRYPDSHADFIAQCHEAGQSRPTPLILRYGADDYNCLHQDLYGPLAFPLQAAILLSQPAEDFTGGEFVLTEQRPRQQSRPMVVPLSKGDAVIFAVHHRPVRGKNGFYRVNLRHGVSRVRSGHRHTLGIIFHDAQ